jgi:hypothetical protein
MYQCKYCFRAKTRADNFVMANRMLVIEVRSFQCPIHEASEKSGLSQELVDLDFPTSLSPNRRRCGAL